MTTSASTSSTSNSSSSAEDHSGASIIKKMDFSTLARTLNFNPIKLDRSNYIHWKTQVFPAISALDLEDFIDPTKRPSTKFVEVRSVNSAGESIIEQRVNADFSSWKKSDQWLLCWLLSTVSEKVIGQVTHCRTSLDFWSRLENLYSQQSMAKVMALKHQLQNIKKGSGSVSDFVLKIKEIGDALMAAGEEVKDRDLILTLMGGIGHEYDSVVTLVSSQQKTMTLEEAQFLCLMHEQRIEQLNTSVQISVPEASVNYASNNNVGGGQRNTYSYNGNSRNNNNNYRGRGGRSNNRSRIYCQVCSKPGHGALKCYKRFDKDFQGSQQNSQAHMVQQHEGCGGIQTSSNNNSQYFSHSQQPVYHQSSSAYFASPETVSDPAWYIDSGATNHVTADMKNLSLKSAYRGSENEENTSSRYP